MNHSSSRSYELRIAIACNNRGLCWSRWMLHISFQLCVCVRACLYLYVYIDFCSIPLYFYLWIHPYIHLFIYLSINLSVYVPIYLCVFLSSSLYISTQLINYLPTYPSLYSSVCLSVNLFLSISMAVWNLKYYHSRIAETLHENVTLESTV